MMKSKSKVPEIVMPTYWNEKILFSCPNCSYENTLEHLNLEHKFSDFHQIFMYFAKCPRCNHEHVILG